MDEQILSKELKEDKKLRLSNSDERHDGGFKTIIEKSISNNIVNSEDKTKALKRILEKPISGPNNYVLASLSERIYKDEKRDDTGEYCHGKKILDNYDWQLLTVAESSEELMSDTSSKNVIQPLNKSVQNVTMGYFGAAYWEPNSQHVIIVHSGTKSIDGALSDLNGVMLNRHVSQIDSAVTFTDKVIRVIKDINKQKGTNIQLYITGHSLGAWLAPITAFSAKYLVNKNGKFLFSSELEETSYHTRTVIFDPPGCEEMLRRIQSRVMDRYSPSSVDCLDITTFVSAPNVINACNHHVGDVYRLIVDLSSADEESVKKKLKEFFDIYVNYTRFVHSIVRIRKTFDPNTGEVLTDKDGNLRIKKVKDWPLLLSGDESAKSRNKILLIIKFILKFTFRRIPVINLAIDIGEGIHAGISFVKWHLEFKEELIKFFQLAKLSNNYRPAKEKLLLQCGGRVIRYKDENVSENYRNECNVKIFTKYERQFIERYKFLEKFQDDLNDIVQLKDLFGSLKDDEQLINEILNVLRVCEMKNEIIYSNNVLEHVLFIKYLLHLFPDVRVKTETIYNELPRDLHRKFYQLLSSSYLVSIQNQLILKPKFDHSSILKDDFQFWHWILSDSLLGVSMIWNILKETDNVYKKDANHIFLNLERIFYLGGDLFLNFLKKIDHSYLIVIEFNDVILFDKAKEFFKDLFKILEVNRFVKTIIVTEKCSQFNECISKYKDVSPLYHEKFYEARFNDFDSDSQTLFLQKTVIFQGKEVPLNTVINSNNSELDSIIDSETIVKLVKNNKIEIGTILPSLGETEVYYINRTLVKKIKVNKNILKDDNITDIFLISNIEKEKLSQLVNGKKVITYGEENPDKSNPIRFVAMSEHFNKCFSCFCQEFKDNSIHWLEMKENEDFIWRKSHGKTLSGLRSYIENYEKDLNEEDYTTSSTSIRMFNVDDCTTFDDRFVIIAAEPGMGKTTALTRLGINKSDESKWLIRMNLKECDFKQTLFNKVDDIVEFLYQNRIIYNAFSKRLMQMRLNSDGNVVFFFDEFDEILPENQKNFLNLLRKFQETHVERVVISTRLHLRNELENNLSTVAYTFKPFFHADQKQFLQKFWGKELDPSTDKVFLDNYINIILKFISNSIGDKDKKFMGIPLQMMMIAEAFLEVVKDESLICDPELCLPKDFNMLKLYDKFIKTKYLIYLRKKCADSKLFSDMEITLFSKGYNEVLMHLATKGLFPELIESILPGKKLCEESMHVVNLIGVAQYIDGKTVFIHPTFGEYFAAFFLIEKMNENEKNFKTIVHFLSKELFSSKNEVIKIFLDYRLAQNKIHYFALKGKFEDLRNHLTEKTSGVNIDDGDNLGRSIVHYGAQEEDLSTIKLFIQKGGNVKKRDKLGKTALHYAARYNRRTDLINVLLENALDIINVKDGNGRTAVYYAAQQGNWDIVDRILTETSASLEGLDTEKLLFHYTYKGSLEGIQTVLKDKNIDFKNFKDNQGNTLLHTAIQRSHIKIIDILLTNVDVNVTNKSGKTAISYAAENKDWNIVETLLRKKANFNDLSDQQKLSLLNNHSVKNSNWDVVKLFMSDNGRDNYYNHLSFDHRIELLCFIIDTKNLVDNDLKIAKFLIEKGIPMNKKDKRHKFPIQYALENELWAVVVYFLRYGSNLSYLNKKQQGLLLSYCKLKSYWDVVKLCMINDNNREEFLNNPEFNHVLKFLCYIIQLNASEDISLIEFLIKNCTNVNINDNHLKKPIHYASENKRWDIVDLLIQKGAHVFDLNEANQMEYLNQSIDNSKWNIVKLFLKNHKYLNNFTIYLNEQQKVEFLCDVVRFSDMGIVMYTLGKGIDYSLSDKFGKKPLNYAFENKQWLILEILLMKGAYFKDLNNDERLFLVKYFVENSRWHTLKQLMNEEERDSYFNVLTEEQKIRFLYHIISFGNLNVTIYCIKKLIELKIINDINFKNDLGITFLHAAAEKGHLSIVQYLVEQRNAEINVSDYSKCTPLFLASQYGHLEVVKYLSKMGADFYQENAVNIAPLDIARENGHESVEKFLSHIDILRKELFCAINRGDLEELKQRIEINKFDINFRFKNGFTLLHKAVIGVQPKIMTYLIEKGADLRIKDDFGNTALHWTSFMSQTPILFCLLPEDIFKNTSSFKDIQNNKPVWFYVLFDKDKKDYFFKKSGPFEKYSSHYCELLCGGYGNINKGLKELHLEQQKELLPMLKLISDAKNVDLMEKNYNGYTILHLLAYGKSLDAIKFLIKEKNINADSRTSNNSSPLSFVTLKEIAKYLIENGCYVNHRNDFGNSAMHYAASTNNLEIVECLIENGASIEEKNNDGEIPLHMAIKCNHWCVVKYLIEKGTDTVLTFVNIHGKTALDLATSENIIELIKTELEKKLMYAATAGDLQYVKTLINQGVSIDAKNQKNYTPLFLATYEGHVNAAEYLLEKGAKFVQQGTEYNILHYAVVGSIKCQSILKLILVKMKEACIDFDEYLNTNTSNITPLSLAIELKLVKQVYLLLKYGSKTDIVDNNGMTELHWAARNDTLEIVKILVNFGFNPHHHDNKGRKPIHFAAWHGRMEIVKFFINLGVDVDDYDKDGRTILHYAFCSNHPLDICNFFTDGGTFFNAKDKNDKTPLDYALERVFGKEIKIENINQNLSILKKIDRPSSFEFPDYRQLNINSVIECAKKSLKPGTSVNQDVITKYKKLCDTFYEQGYYKEAYWSYKLVLFFLEPYDNIAYLKIQMMLGVTASKLCKYEEAQLVLEKVVDALSVEYVGPNNLKTLTARHNLAEVFYKQGKYNQALEIYEDVLNKREKVLGSEDRDVLTTKHHIARCMNNQGKHYRALKRFQSIQVLQKKALGENDPDTLKTEHNIAFTLYRLYRYSEASSLIEKVLVARKRVLGENHPDYLTSRHVKALILQAKGEPVDALNILVEIYSIQEKMFGLDHTDTLETKHDIASAMHAQGNQEEAMSIFHDVYTRKKNLLGPDHLYTSYTLGFINGSRCCIQ